MSKRKAVAGSISGSEGKRRHQSSLSGFFASSSSSSSGGMTTSSASSSSCQSSPRRYRIFCDLDGVLCDFDEGVRRIFNGRGPDQLQSGQMWAAISRADDFYAHLPWTKDGRDLWRALVPLRPDVLTGVPRAKKSRAQKAAWCRRELPRVTTSSSAAATGGSGGATGGGGDVIVVNHVDMAGPKNSHEVVEGRRRDGVVNVITCWSKNKHRESGRGAVLIDDRSDFAPAWTENGGIFIHHTDTASTLSKLRDKGILPPLAAEEICQSSEDDEDEVQIIGVVGGKSS